MALARGLLEHRLRLVFGEPPGSVRAPVSGTRLPLAQTSFARNQGGGN